MRVLFDQAGLGDKQTFTVVLKDMTDELTMKAALEQERLESSKKSNLMSAVYSSTVDAIVICDELGKVCGAQLAESPLWFVRRRLAI
jgi:phage FluMu protein gp41